MWEHLLGSIEVRRGLIMLQFFAVTYLENNKAGMTVYGFMMDRTWLHTIFGIELALLLWLLNKTIGIYVLTKQNNMQNF